MDYSVITASDLQDEIKDPIIFKEYREQVSKRTEDGGYMNILARYTSSVFLVFERYLVTEVDLVEEDIRLVLDEYNLNFILYELEQGFYIFRDLSESVFKILQPHYLASSNVIVIEFDDITIENKLVARDGSIAITFDEKLFSRTILGFNHGWDYKHYNEYISQKVVNLSTTNERHLKTDVVDCSVVNRARESLLCSFVLDKPSSYEVFCEPETILYKKYEKVCSKYYKILLRGCYY